MTKPTGAEIFAHLVLRKSADRIQWVNAKDAAAKLIDVNTLKASRGGKESLGEEFDELNALAEAAEAWKKAHHGSSLAPQNLRIIELQADKVRLLIQDYLMECKRHIAQLNAQVDTLRKDLPKLVAGAARDKGTAALKKAREQLAGWDVIEGKLATLESRPASIVVVAKRP